ncbi:uncharacterized protein [Hetaerina americana]|uniref:uncharacterized protein n=1 Tax=Hetaerina americana TaxID=62018 RepID=UPI003A7F2D3E
MKPSLAAALVGLLVALLPWLPACPARIAAADLPPAPHTGGNATADGGPLEVLSMPAPRASSNAVLAGGDKAGARSILPVNDPPDTAPNCTENCRHTVPAEHPGNASLDAAAGKETAVAAREGERRPEEAPMPAGGEISSNHAPEGGDALPAVVPQAAVNASADPSPPAVVAPPVSSAPRPPDVGDAAPYPPSTTTGRTFAMAIEGNHVFPSTSEGLGPPRVTADRGVAAADPDMDLVDSKETSTAAGKETLTPGSTRTTSALVTSTPETSTAGKGGKASKETKYKSKAGDKGREENEGVFREEPEDAEEEDAEGEDPWDSGSHEERSTTPGDSAPDEDGTSLYYRHLIRMESQDFEEPGTTRSYVVVEKSTKLDYSSSSVVSEVYDSESPAEEDSTEEPSATDEESSGSGKHTGSSAPSPLDAIESHSGEEQETSDSPEYGEEERMEEGVYADTGHTITTAAPTVGSKDQDPASSARGGEARATLQTSRVPEGTTPLIPTSTERDADTTARTKMEEATSLRNWAHEEGSESNDTSGQTDAPSPTVVTTTSSMEPHKGSSHGSGYATARATLATTSTHSPRTSRRMNVLHPSTTESPVKNEVTYNESITGPTYDFKANLSLTTPMVHLLLSAAPMTVTVAPESMKGSQIPSVSPTTLQTIDQSLQSAMLMSTSMTASTTEPSYSTTDQASVEDTQGRGNSINDWSSVSNSGGMASGGEAEPSTAPPATSPSGIITDESPTPSSLSVTSSVAFSLAQNMSASDLVSESTSSTPEEATSVTSSGSTVVYSESVSDRVTTEQFGSDNESSSVSPMSSTFEPMSIADNATSSAAAYGTGVTPAVGSSTTHDLHPYKVETKMPAVSPEDEEGTDRRGVAISETFTVQPLSTIVNQNPTLSPESSSISTATKGLSLETTFPPIVVKLNGSGFMGTIAPSHKMSTASSGLIESEESIITYPWHVRLVMKISWSEVCHSKQQISLKQALAQLISSALISTSSDSTLPAERVLLLNVGGSCPNASGSPSEVHFCILSSTVAEPLGDGGKGEDNRNGATVVHCDATLMQLFLNIWDKTPKPMVEPLTHVKEVGIAHSGLNVDVPANSSDDNAGVQAAIGISCIAAVALFLLAALLIIMRRRQRRFNYGQRCTPVSLDAYSLDSVSVREGSRRARNGGVGRHGVNGLSKGDNDWRASKRSYGNPAFEDDDGEEVLLSKPMNFATLTNAALNEDGALADEFRLIPKRFHKRTVRRRKSRLRSRDTATTAERGEAAGSKDDQDDDDDHLPEGAEEKNRYANVVPLTSTRVRLSARPSGPLSTYINANFVRGPKNEERFYIACQAPLQSTVEDFWRMIWEQQSKVILMLTNLVENSVEKCADYLPPSEVLDCHRLFGDFQVTLKKREVREKYIVSSLQLKNMESNLWREVTHLWFLGWPDQGVPEEANQIIAFLIEARSFTKANPGPTVVHCSPGTGRTGTVISIDICIREFEQSRMIDVPKVVQQLRRDREGAVQTQQQYAFIYKALSLYAAKLTGGAMDSF